MPARAGMADIILRLRGMVDAGTADYVVGGVSYWSDDVLQDRLDAYRTELNSTPLTSVAEQDNAGSVHYFTYYVGYKNLEGTASGTVYWEVHDGLGSALPTSSYTPDYIYGSLRFTNDTLGTIYYIRARSYNLEAAAGQIWRTKAAHVASSFDFASDNQRFNKAKLMENYLQMANYWDAKGGVSTGIRSVQMVRTDLLPKQGGDWS